MIRPKTTADPGSDTPENGSSERNPGRPLSKFQGCRGGFQGTAVADVASPRRIRRRDGEDLREQLHGLLEATRAPHALAGDEARVAGNGGGRVHARRLKLARIPSRVEPNLNKVPLKFAKKDVR